MHVIYNFHYAVLFTSLSTQNPRFLAVPTRTRAISVILRHSDALITYQRFEMLPKKKLAQSHML